MEVLEIKELIRKDIPLYYRNEYSGVAIFSVIGKEIETAIEIVVEKSPVGHTDIRVHFLETFDFPLLPAQIKLKKHIKDLIQLGEIS